MITKEQNIYDSIFNCETRDDKKALLKQMSTNAKALIELGDERTVNEILLDWYTNEEHQEFHTIKDWNEKGFRVVKGQKAFFIWSKKRTGIEKNEDTNEEQEFEFFSLAYLFSNAQVEALKSA